MIDHCLRQTGGLKQQTFLGVLVQRHCMDRRLRSRAMLLVVSIVSESWLFLSVFLWFHSIIMFRVFFSFCSSSSIMSSFVTTFGSCSIWNVQGGGWSDARTSSTLKSSHSKFCNPLQIDIKIEIKTSSSTHNKSVQCKPFCSHGK